MKRRSVTPMRIAKSGYIVTSIAFLVIGILLISSPHISTIVIGRMMGIAMIIFGAVKLVGYFSKDLFRLAFQFDLEFGILLMVVGLIALIHPVNIINFLCIALGVSMFADAMFKIRISADSRKFGIGSWWLILMMAIVTGLAGLLLIIRPSEGAEVLTVLLGISVLSEGILNLCVAISTVKIVKNQHPDVIEMDYSEEKFDRKD